MAKKTRKKPTRKETTELRAHDLSEFVNIFTRIANKWSERAGGYIIYFHPWFRGHQDASWTLLPKLYRSEYTSVDEDDSRKEFKLKSLPHVGSTLPQTDWHWLFLMQHYGLPTRLLDWTESALVALYFAVRNHLGEYDAAVWMLDPFHLNKNVAKVGDYVHDIFSEGVNQYLESADVAELPAAPMAIDPLYNSVRITVQRGAFTIHGQDRKPVEQYDTMKERCLKIIIPSECIETIMSQLSWAGMRETSVFPDLDSVSKEIVDYYLQ
jgi:hypothetical protein